MDEYYLRGGNRGVPAFGSWEDCNNEQRLVGGLPFTECFDRARQARFLRCTYSQERDLYVAGDLYDDDVDDVAPPAMILVPRRRVTVKQGKRREREASAWVVCDADDDDMVEEVVKEPPSPLTPSPPRQRPPKAVDEDLYKISPELLYAKSTTRRRKWGFLSSCLQPSCL